MTIREERPEDIPAVRRVNEEAFGRPDEARLVDALRANGGLDLSLVAVVQGEIVGHVAYSPVRLETAAGDVAGAGLGPMAVLPGFQRRGIGSRLVVEGTRRMRERDIPLIVVLGHPDYYPRFGFVPARHHGIRSEWTAGDAFMVLVLDPRPLAERSGLARYRDEFHAVD